jgi:hypothetical protein
LFVAAAKQDDESLATPDKIDTISRTAIDPHFADAFARRSIARVAERQAIDSGFVSALALTSSRSRNHFRKIAVRRISAVGRGRART